MLMKLISLIGEKKFKLDEFLPIYSDVKKNKDMGTYEDFMAYFLHTEVPVKNIES